MVSQKVEDHMEFTLLKRTVIHHPKSHPTGIIMYICNNVYININIYIYINPNNALFLKTNQMTQDHP